MKLCYKDLGHNKQNTVKPLYNHTKMMIVVDRWSLFRVNLCNESFKLDHKIVFVIDRWSLFGGGR
jgi:hypothetical protein